jgi:hypothetical protein
MLDRQRLVCRRQAEKLNVAYVSLDADHFSWELAIKIESRQWRKSWAGRAAIPASHEGQVTGNQIA